MLINGRALSDGNKGGFGSHAVAVLVGNNTLELSPVARLGHRYRVSIGHDTALAPRAAAIIFDVPLVCQIDTGRGHLDGCCLAELCGSVCRLSSDRRFCVSLGIVVTDHHDIRGNAVAVLIGNDALELASVARLGHLYRVSIGRGTALRPSALAFVFQVPLIVQVGTFGFDRYSRGLSGLDRDAYGLSDDRRDCILCPLIFCK